VFFSSQTLVFSASRLLKPLIFSVSRVFSAPVSQNLSSSRTSSEKPERIPRYTSDNPMPHPTRKSKDFFEPTLTKAIWIQVILHRDPNLVPLTRESAPQTMVNTLHVTSREAPGPEDSDALCWNLEGHYLGFEERRIKTGRKGSTKFRQYPVRQSIIRQPTTICPKATAKEDQLQPHTHSLQRTMPVRKPKKNLKCQGVRKQKKNLAASGD